MLWLIDKLNHPFRIFGRVECLNHKLCVWTSYRETVRDYPELGGKN